MRRLLSLLLVLAPLSAHAVEVAFTATPTALVAGPIPIGVTATSASSRVDHVDFYVDATLLGTLPGPAQHAMQPVWSFYSWSWDSRGVGDGPHTVTAIAYETGGAQASAVEGISVSNVSPPCIPAGQAIGDAAAITAALVGPDAQAVLCPYQTYFLEQTIRFTAPGQGIYTAGFPLDRARARVVLNSSVDTTALNGIDVARVGIRSIEVQGPDPSGPVLENDFNNNIVREALILLGGTADDQFVDGVRAMDPRSWSALHVFEADCTHAVITRNTLGPSGRGAYNGVTFPWADGLSFACRDSTVTDNTILDATDGALVVFDAPGTLVARNTVTSYTRIMLGGIGMVDTLPYFGNSFAGTRVESNVIDARWYMKVAVPIGNNAWGCANADDDQVYDGVVRDNQLTGAHMGYGIPANGATGFFITSNTSTATHSGTPAGCPGRPSASPAAFQVTGVHNDDMHLQSGYALGRVEFIPGLTFPGMTDRVLNPGSITEVSGAAGSEAVYDFYVPPGLSSAVIQITPGLGDADLYVRRGEPPTTSVWDCRPYTPTSAETCGWINPTEGHYYVLIRGKSLFANVNLYAGYNSYLSSGAAVGPIRSMAGVTRLSSINVPAGTHTLTVTTTGGRGDADLFVARTGTASLSHYDCASVSGLPAETCVLSVTGPTTASIAVYGNEDFYGVMLRAVVSP